MYSDFKILSKNNTDELIFYKMLERKKKIKEKIQYLHIVKKKKKIKSKIIEEKELIPYF